MHEDLFDLMISEREREFIEKVIELEGEEITDLVEFLGGFPFIGSLVKLGKIGVNYMDLHFVCKIGKFMKKSEDISTEKKERFLQKLSKSRRKKLYEHLIHFLYVAESNEKAEILGLIYRERVLDRIDDDMFLRLCAVVNKVFVDDLRSLGRYLEPSAELNYITDNLNAGGLLTNFMGHRFENGKLTMMTTNELNDIGQNLYSILKDANWFQS